MRAPMKDLAPVRAVVEPDPELHAMYGEFFELWAQLYEDLSGSMARHHALVSHYSSPEPSAISGAGGAS
jgi:xylulokinase